MWGPKAEGLKRAERWSSSMLLFRRTRKEKEEPKVEGGKPPGKAPSPPSPAAPKVESKPVPLTVAPAPALRVSAPAPAPPVVTAAPPPRLPEKTPVVSVRPRAERGPFGVCFVCGSVLEGRMCPTCRIAWLE
jgi:hypothetical protein